jgi:hypothetical protein
MFTPSTPIKIEYFHQGLKNLLESTAWKNWDMAYLLLQSDLDQSRSNVASG